MNFTCVCVCLYILLYINYHRLISTDYVKDTKDDFILHSTFFPTFNVIGDFDGNNDLIKIANSSKTFESVNCR